MYTIHTMIRFVTPSLPFRLRYASHDANDKIRDHSSSAWSRTFQNAIKRIASFEARVFARNSD